MGYDVKSFCVKCGALANCLCATEGGTKHDSGKPDLSLMPTHAMNEICAVWSFGQKKYASFNWAKGFAYRRPIAAALRHIFAWLGGENTDTESGLSHLAHAICCLCMVIHFQKTKTGKDDRHGAD